MNVSSSFPLFLANIFLGSNRIEKVRTVSMVLNSTNICDSFCALFVETERGEGNHRPRNEMFLILIY